MADERSKSSGDDIGAELARKPIYDDDFKYLGDETLRIKPRESFGDFLRAERSRRGLNLRDAAGLLAVSFSFLQRVETNGRVKNPTLAFFRRVAEIYDVPINEVLRQAGAFAAYDHVGPGGTTSDEAFVNLYWRCDALRPERLDGPHLDYYARLQKQQIVQFALKLEAHVRRGGMSVSDIVAGLWPVSAGEEEK